MPTVNYQVAASANDGHWYSSFSATATATNYGVNSGGTVIHNFYRWTGVTIPAGAKIISAKVLCYDQAGGSGSILDGTKLHFCKAANPAAPTSVTSANALALTTAYVKPAMSTGGTWFEQPDVKDIIQELVDAYSYASGAAMMCVIKAVSGASGNCAAIILYDYGDHTYGPKLQITYTLGGLLPRRRSFNSLLVR